MNQPGLFDDGIDYSTVRPVDGPLVERRTCRTCGRSKPMWEYGWRQKRLASGKTKRYRKSDCHQCLADAAKAIRERRKAAETAPEM